MIIPCLCAHHDVIYTENSLWMIMVVLIEPNNLLGLVWFWVSIFFILCHHIDVGRRISMNKSNDDITFIKLYQLSIVSRYNPGISVTNFDHNKECILTIIGRIRYIVLCIM